MVSIIISIIGLLFALFIPGFFITLLFFRESDILERVMLSVTFSIMISIAIGIGLGYNKGVKEITGGISPMNVWIWELIVTAVFAVPALIANRKNINLKSIKNLADKLRVKAKSLSKNEEEIVKFKKL